MKSKTHLDKSGLFKTVQFCGDFMASRPVCNSNVQTASLHLITRLQHYYRWCPPEPWKSSHCRWGNWSSHGMRNVSSTCLLPTSSPQKKKERNHIRTGSQDCALGLQSGLSSLYIILPLLRMMTLANTYTVLGHCSKGFTQINSFNPRSSPVWCIILVL